MLQTNLGDRGNEGSFGLISLSLLKNIPVFIELKNVGVCYNTGERTDIKILSAHNTTTLFVHLKLTVTRG